MVGPVSAEEFARLMAPLGPWPEDRRIAVAVSGGADSLALALLTQGWGAPFAFVIDHGLRPESADEAAVTETRLRGLGIPVRLVRLAGLAPGAGLAARARAARYAALFALCRAEGLADLLLGHHLRDQAETVLIRRLGASGEAGLAGMAAVVEAEDARLVRPLLGVAPGRLRATLRAAGLDWVEDPSNRDPRALRARLRLGLDDPDGTRPETAALSAEAMAHGRERRDREAAIAAWLAARATIRPEGFAVLDAESAPQEALAALLRMLGGHPYPPRGAALRGMAAALCPGTLAGIRIAPAGRLGSGWLLAREAAALAPPVPALPGAVWDGRFRLRAGAVPPPAAWRGATLGALGDAAARFRHRSGLPAMVLRTLPALRVEETLVAVPHLGYPFPDSCAAVPLVFAPLVPAAGAVFLAPDTLPVLR